MDDKCPDNPFIEVGGQPNGRCLEYQFALQYPGAPNLANPRDRPNTVKMQPMQVFESVEPGKPVLQLFDRCKWLEAELAREKMKTEQLVLELAALRAGDEEEGETRQRSRAVKKG